MGIVLFAAVAVTALVVALTGRAEANHRFSDIATGTFFHDSTGWLKDNGIADGFGDGTFKPNNDITRAQASYWFANYNNSLELVLRTFPADGSAVFTTGSAQCPVGKRPVAGGGNTTQGWVMEASFPVPSLRLWQVNYVSRDGTSESVGVRDTWVLCAPETVP